MIIETRESIKICKTKFDSAVTSKNVSPEIFVRITDIQIFDYFCVKHFFFLFFTCLCYFSGEKLFFLCLNTFIFVFISSNWIVAVYVFLNCRTSVFGFFRYRIHMFLFVYVTSAANVDMYRTGAAS